MLSPKSVAGDTCGWGPLSSSFSMEILASYGWALEANQKSASKSVKPAFAPLCCGYAVSL